jgi:hypothetical protein
MGINDQVRFHLLMTCHMDIGHPVKGQFSNIILCIIIVIKGIDIDLVYIQQKLAIGPLYDLGNKFYLAHLCSHWRIVRYIFDGQMAFKLILDPPDPVHHKIDGIPAKWDWQQVIQVGVGTLGITQMFRIDGNLVGIQEFL